MTSKTDAIKDKLRKILAIVRSNGNEFERNMAMQRLQEMLVKHRLDMSDIEERAKEGIAKNEMIGTNGPWARSVAQNIAKLYFCNYYFQRIGPSNDHRFVKHVFVGRPHETEVAKELTQLIFEQLLSESAAQARKSGDPSFQRSFLNAAANAISHRVHDLITAASSETQEQSKSTALLVLNAYELAKTENSNYLETTGIKITTKTSRTKTKSWAGATEGKTFGNNIPLNLAKKLN